ncbi:MAG: YggS family pyridoxal phosphate-dependent enzyme [Pseudomonadales bacterium]|nr:YggS family pyridoxal phosphate-dependent enzyme [Pseudomonadales bacterium]
MTSLTDNLHNVQQQIDHACREYGRPVSDVMLLAVSKTKPLSMVEEALRAGQLEFGENYLQDAMDKVPLLPEAHWHFIGNVQSNKTRQIANHFDWVHSVASKKIAQRLSDQREGPEPLNILLQVNVSDDTAKVGSSIDQTGELLGHVLEMENLRPRGLMTITEHIDDPAQQRQYFAMLARLRDDLNTEFSIINFDQLSMGMTQDLHSAIAEGATIVRIGTAIFGERESSKKEQLQ